MSAGADGDRLPYLVAKLKAPGSASASGDRRARPRGGLELRGLPGGAARGRGLRPRRLRRARDPLGRLSGPQNARGLRLGRPASPSGRWWSTWRSWPGSPSGQRLLLRAARDRQDATWRSRWRSGPARPATGSPSPPPQNGSPASRPPRTRNSLDAELRRMERYGLIVVDEVGYLPLERQAANLLFALVARRYERGSIIVTSNRGFEAWGEILGDRDGRRRADRPPRPPRTDRHAQGQELPPARAGHRDRARDSCSAATRLRLTRGRARVEHYWVPDSGALFGSC